MRALAAGRGRTIGLALLVALVAVLPSCEWDGNFTILGYTTKPNYDLGIHTVRVPIFQNLTMYRGLEFQLTRAVVREIEAKTPYKVVSCDCEADTELVGKIISFNKAIVNGNQLNEVREAETTLGVEVFWRNLRTGDLLSQPKPRVPPPPDAPPPVPVPVLIQSLGDFIPELGGSITTAQKQNVDRLAIQIVSMMEVPW